MVWARVFHRCVLTPGRDTPHPKAVFPVVLISPLGSSFGRNALDVIVQIYRLIAVSRSVFALSSYSNMFCP